MREVDSIRIQNLYYIFLYTWEKFREGRSINVGQEDGSNIQNLLAKILVNSVKRIIKKGILKDYKLITNHQSFIKGKIDFRESIKKKFLVTNRVTCQYSEMSEDTFLNSTIKLTLQNLVKSKDLHSEIKQEIWSILKYFEDVKPQNSARFYLSKIDLSQNSNFYRLTIEICKMIEYLLQPTQIGEENIFKNILEDEIKMSDIFERFVANFFRYEQNLLRVKSSEQLEWNFKSLGGDLNLVPKQRTDITLKNQEKIIIIDTKYYKNSLSESYYEQQKFRSEHLRQITSYMINMEDISSDEINLEGVLLYAEAEGTQKLNEQYFWRGHKVSVKSINLNQNWHDIHNDLLSIIGQNPI